MRKQNNIGVRERKRKRERGTAKTEHTDFYEPFAKRKSIKEELTVPSPACTVINYETFVVKRGQVEGWKRTVRRYERL